MTSALQVIEGPDVSAQQIEASVLLVEAKALVIHDDESYLRVTEFAKGCVALRKQIEEKFAEPVRRANEAHKSLTAWREKELDPVKEAEALAKKCMSGYETEQRARAEEERRRLEAEARKREEDRLLAEAQSAQDDGDDAAAEELLSMPVEVAPVYVAPPTPKVQGIAYREDWKAEVTSPIDLVRHVAQHPEDIGLLSVNSTALAQMARARKSALRIPGVRAYSVKTPIIGGRR